MYESGAYKLRCSDSIKLPPHELMPVTRMRSQVRDRNLMLSVFGPGWPHGAQSTVPLAVMFVPIGPPQMASA